VNDPVMSFESVEAAHAWFDANAATSDGIWLRIAKGKLAGTTVDYKEALDVALCHGWIDGAKKTEDEAYWQQRFTPRRARSKWSQVNRDKAEALVQAGLMRPRGAEEMAKAKADGRWDAAYAGAKAATVPDDLAAALDADPEARAFFDTLTGNNRYAILYRVQDAKKPETRARRIEKFVAMCRAHETVHPNGS
jgi:uncharacterized protein YdeI (YjbR/CyaY-like superfamily)